MFCETVSWETCEGETLGGIVELCQVTPSGGESTTACRQQAYFMLLTVSVSVICVVCMQLPGLNQSFG